MKNIALLGSLKSIKKVEQDIYEKHPEIENVNCIDIDRISLSDIQVPDNTQEVILVLNKGDGKQIRTILLNLPPKRFSIKYIPIYEKDDNISYESRRDLSPEDFLARPLNAQSPELQDKYKGLKVLVYGGAGSIGSEIVLQLLNLGVKQVIVYDLCEYSVFKLKQHLETIGIQSDRFKIILGNILNRDKLKHVLQVVKPDMVIHAAAYKHVHLMEQNIDEAILTNLEGTKNVVDTAIEENIKELIFISTDKVISPQNIMGATKRLSEYYIHQADALKTKINIVRFGNVIKSRGSVIPIWEEQLSKKLPLTITDIKAKRFFISIPEAATLVLSTKLYNSSKEVFILNMGNLILINDVALCLIKSRGLIPQVDVKLEYIGLRQGEKLSEELFTKKEWENVELTQNGHIYHLKKFDSEFQNVKDIFDKLIGDAKSQKSQEYLRQQFCLLFPSLLKNNK